MTRSAIAHARALAAPLGRPVLAAAAFVVLSAAFFAVIGRNPFTLIGVVLEAAVGDGYAIGESLVRATPILLCALATALPARVGLISVGAEGQFYAGAIAGTGTVLSMLPTPGWTVLPLMLVTGALGGMAWSLVSGLLRTGLQVNETISTLLTNYVAALLVTWLVYGPWKNPASQGWPATAEFPAASKLPALLDSRVHAGLLIGIALAVVLHLVLTRTRWGLVLDVLRSNPRAGLVAGLDFRRHALLVMALGGALAGLAGIAETASIQGRLQSDIAGGAGFSGFLVAWLARNHCLRIIPLSLLVGALLASGDGLQMLAQVPSSVTLVIQGLLFVAVLLVNGWLDRGRPA
jgi:general nucleoside transport system permease protein